MFRNTQPRQDFDLQGLGYREELPTIQGRTPDSQNEVNVAMALEQLDLDYIYQYWVGSARMPGSIEIDFLVMTKPKPTPLWVHGEYWHTGRHGIEDELQEAIIASRTRNHWHEPVTIWDHECDTVEDAVENLKELLHI
jgi:hypothetical protein